MFALTHVAVAFGGTPVLDGLDLRVAPGQRIALVGENGSGKTTLLRLLAGGLVPDAGRIERPRTVVLQQQVPTWPDGTTVEGVLTRARATADALVAAVTTAGERLAAQPDDDAAADGLAAAIGAADAAEAWTAADRVAAAARDLGVADLDPARPVRQLSGGQRARLHLVEVLADAGPDAGLLFDEPTNHLDDVTVAALTERLRSHAGPVVFASHDRQLIEDVATGVLDLDPAQGAPVVVPGGWSAHRAHHARRRAAWAQAFADHRTAVDSARAGTRTTTRDVAHGRGPTDGDKFVHHFKGERVQGVAAGRIRRAERELAQLQADRVAKPPPTLHLRADVLTGTAPTGVLLSAQGVAVAGRLAPTRLDVPAGARILLTGPNGVGKSTLLAVLDGSIAPSEGVVLRQPGTAVVRLAQEVEAVDGVTTPAGLYAARVGSDAPPLVELGLVQPRDLHRPVGELSVGQRRRLALAVAIAAAPGVLLLDEPTDHLSLTLVEELEVALAASPGAVVVASHDRWLRDRWDGEVVPIGSGRAARGRRRRGG